MLSVQEVFCMKKVEETAGKKIVFIMQKHCFENLNNDNDN